MTTPAVPSGEMSIKAHDRLPVVDAVLGFEGGAVADLTTATAVHFIMRDRGKPAGAAKVDAPAIILDPLLGTVRYEWAIGDTDVPSVYNAEWEVTYEDGRKQTFPTKSYHTINVLADLDLE